MTEKNMTEKKSKTVTGWDVLALLTLPLNILFQGYVVMRLWDWHVIPVFAAPPLSLGHAVGIHTLWGILKGYKKSDPDQSLSDATVQGVLIYSLALFVGWCAR